MQKMSGLDLEFSVAELAHLQGKRIAKIRRTQSGIFLFKIGSEEILFQPGVRLHLTRQAFQATESPDGFVAYLRKNFEGKTAAKISQVPLERIVEIETKSKERLVFELFRKGNLIVVLEDGTIASCLEKDDAGGRRVARSEKYEYPKSTPFEFKRPAKTGFVVQLNEESEPVSYSLDSEKGGNSFPTFSEAADFYYANQKEESGAQAAAREKVKKLEERLASQQKTLEEFEKKRHEAKAAGDDIYANFERVEQLLLLVRKMKKSGASEEEINAAISSHKAKIKGSEIEIDV
jgi:predicted ribosome quality control (RQC) complex YloA/Tae2 family protein